MFRYFQSRVLGNILSCLSCTLFKYKGRKPTDVNRCPPSLSFCLTDFSRLSGTVHITSRSFPVCSACHPDYISFCHVVDLRIRSYSQKKC